MTEPFQTRTLPESVDAIAPDQSEIRFLVQVEGGSMVHCCLPVGAVSLAVTHRTVEEVWYVLSGQGELWRQQGEQQQIVTLQPGLSLSIPLGTHFQFRNTGRDPLQFIIVTMPPWPGADEAVRVPDYWPTS
ncbi:cupin domain-containing protein [Thermostichus vulcanus]|uniref:Cupin domain-containing protein n=1 Tax=Thermostichus vulcanus str. 'Rupite' TaxID=2813851 RepID=A0ABT0CBY4_THEVL|nr:cupin domain-containing protein [Thermostichus vulcanus]MCJ2543304.1 cupin domain-containing protein [Thermostichus vulcanus str. 'Rupite']